jgi:hypothetical protein
MKPIAAFLRSIGIFVVVYIDDWLIIARSKAAALTSFHLVCTVLKALGFVVNTEKSIAEPTQRLDFLGHTVDSTQMRFTLVPQKVEKIQGLCQEMLQVNYVKVRQICKLTGLTEHAAPAIRTGRVHIREIQRVVRSALQQLGSYEAEITLSEAAKQDLVWWLNHMALHNGKRIVPYEPSVTITSDASKLGWGAWCTDNRSTSGFWSPKEVDLGINYLELKAAWFGLKIFARQRFSTLVVLRMDNRTAIAHINRFGGTKSSELNTLARKIFRFLEERDLDVRAEHISGKANVLADDLSRRIDDRSNWQLHPRVFAELESIWGPFSIDLFADRLNAQKDRFISWRPDPKALSVDAFLWDWKSEPLSYAFPPFMFIGKVLYKVVQERADLVLIAPMWAAQSWYPLLLSRLVEEPILLPSFNELLVDSQGNPHAMVQNRSLHLVAWKVSGNDSSVQEFLQRLSIYVCKPGESLLENIMRAPGENGFCGVAEGRLIPFKQMLMRF